MTCLKNAVVWICFAFSYSCLLSPWVFVCVEGNGSLFFLRTCVFVGSLTAFVCSDAISLRIATMLEDRRGKLFLVELSQARMQVLNRSTVSRFCSLHGIFLHTVHDMFDHR